MVPLLLRPLRPLSAHYLARTAAVLGLCVLVSQQSSADPLLQQVEPEVNRRPPTEVTGAGRVSQAAVTTLETRDIIYFTMYQCTVNPHEYCRATENLDVPDREWQICKVIYDKVVDTGYQGERTLNFQPARYATHDPDEPVSFRRAMMAMFVTGDKQNNGGTLRLENLGLRLISSNATTKTRLAAGCDIPQPPGLIGE